MAPSVHRSILRLNFVSWAREGVVSALKARQERNEMKIMQIKPMQQQTTLDNLDEKQ
jgi:hypothetical protein